MMRMMQLDPGPAHPMVRFLTTGMMGGSWAEHVALEMAAGEGFVLVAFYAVIDTLAHQPSVDILKRAVKQEERHVEFGEQQTIKAIARRSGLRRRLTGLHLVSLWGVRRIARFMERRLPKDHEILRFLPAFLEHTNRCAELRMQRIGLIDRPLAQLSAAYKALCVTEAYSMKLPRAAWSGVTLPVRLLTAPVRKKRLTDTYLEDPHVRDFAAAPVDATAAAEARRLGRPERHGASTGSDSAL